VGNAAINSKDQKQNETHRLILSFQIASEAPAARNNDYGFGEVLMFTSVFSFLVSGAGFTTVVSFFCSGGFTTVVLLSFFSAGGFVTVVSFCSQAASSARLASMQIYFFIPMNRITARPVTPLSLKINTMV
jgi:hypothetical protein